MSKLEDEIQYVIVDKETEELWRREVYLSASGAKNSFRHGTTNYTNYRGIYFDDQDKYELVKVKLVRVED